MGKNETSTKLLQLLKNAQSNDEFKKYPELIKLVNESVKSLEKGDNYHNVSASLNQGLQYFGMAHAHGPKGLDELYQATIEGTHGRAYQKLPTGFH